MATLQVTSREFRDNQKNFLDLVDQGRDIVIRRRNKSYLITAIEDDEFRLSPEAWERIERSREQHRNGEVTVCNTAEEAVEFLNSL